MFNEPKPTIKCVGYNEYLNDSSDTAIQCNCTIPSGATKISYILHKLDVKCTMLEMGIIRDIVCDFNGIRWERT